jgi:hypothetical protein
MGGHFSFRERLHFFAHFFDHVGVCHILQYLNRMFAKGTEEANTDFSLYVKGNTAFMCDTLGTLNTIFFTIFLATTVE